MTCKWLIPMGDRRSPKDPLNPLPNVFFFNSLYMGGDPNYLGYLG